jgi:dihydropteroate synthase
MPMRHEDLVWPGGALRLSGRVCVMGILNVTPDSFSDGGSYASPGAAVSRALAMLDEGADVIDVGGESTRPGAEEVTAAGEISRVAPVVAEIVRRRPGAVVSVDTRKADVARAALDAGASIVNDVSALRDDPAMAPLAAGREVPVVLMHMRGTPRTMQANPVYGDVVAEVRAFLAEAFERLEGTLAVTALAVAKGARLVRVHDVKENVRAVRMAEAVLRRQ